MYWGGCYYKRWATMTSWADPCCPLQPPVSPADHLPPITTTISVSCIYLPCCHGSYHYVLQLLYIVQWHPPVSPAHPLHHATADTGVCPFMLLCIFTPPSCICRLHTNFEGEHSLRIVQHLSAAVTTYNNAETVYVSKCWSGAVFPKHFHSQTPFWLQKITTNFHILAYVNTECPDDRYPKLNPCISELISVSYEYILVAYIKHALHDLT